MTGELYQVTPGLVVQCPNVSEHRWTDTMQLRNMRPRKLEVVKRPDAVQTNHVSVTLSVPAHTEKALRARYGDKLATSLTSVLQACAEPEMMILNSVDLDRIQQRLGFRPKSSSELFGRIFQMGEEIGSMKNEVERVTRMAMIRKRGSAEGVILDLGEQLPKAVAKSQESGYDLEEWLGNYVKMSIENDWIAAT